MNLSKPLRLFRIWDVVLIVLLLALVGLTVYFAVMPRTGAFAEIYVDGELYQKVSLSKDAEIDLDHLKIELKAVVLKKDVYIALVSVIKNKLISLQKQHKCFAAI